MAIIRSESCADIWTGSSQSPLRTAYHGASCNIWSSVGSECPQFLVQLFFKYSTICQSVGSHCYYDRIHPQSNQDLPTWSSVLGIEGSGKSFMFNKHFGDRNVSMEIPYFPAYKMHRPIRCTMIFSLEILEKNNDECILILVIYWKKTGLLHTKISNHNIIYSS